MGIQESGLNMQALFDFFSLSGSVPIPVAEFSLATASLRSEGFEFSQVYASHRCIVLIHAPRLSQWTDRQIKLAASSNVLC